MTARDRPAYKQPDPYLRAVDKYRNRGWQLACDCPCHFWRNVKEAVRCCDSAGLRYIASENAYVPWEQQ